MFGNCQKSKISMLTVVLATALSTTVLENGFAADMSFPEPAFITAKMSNQVEKFPGQTVWAGGPNMLYDALTPDGKILMATSPNTASVYAFDTSSGKQLAIVNVGKDSKGLKISPTGKEAYVSNEGANSVSVIDIASFKVVATIATTDMPHNVRFNTDGSTAYVTLQGGAGLGVIDTKARKVVKVIATPGLEGPHNLDLSLDDKTAYVRDVSNHVAVIDLTTDKVKKIITVGQGHAGIDIIPNGRYIFTGAIADEVVTVIDPKTLAVVKQIKVGNGPHGVRASKDSRWLYVTVTADDKLVVIDVDKLEIVKEIKMGSFPFWVAVNGNP